MDKDKYIKFSDAEIGTTLTRPVLISAVNENTAKNGKTFAKISMKDGFTEITATMFDTSLAVLESRGIEKDAVADVVLNINEYQGAKNFLVNDILPCADPSVTMNDFIKVPPVDLNVMYNEIIASLKNAANDYSGKYTPLSDLAVKILEDNKQAYMTSSAAISMHHNLKGGLLYHSYRMVKSAEVICSVYTQLDRELMVCGAALHDIGKIWEYKTDASGSAEFTSSGVLFGHLYMGAALIKKNTEGQNYKGEKIKMLTHMILSHHGLQEYGAVTCPAIAEAFALFTIDNLDAKMYVFEDQRELIAPGQLSEKKPFGMDNRIYIPDL